MKLDTYINRPVLSTVISILIVILGIIGLGCDLVLSRIGKDLFAWEDGRVSFLVKLRRELTAPKNYVFSFRLTEAEKELKEKNNGKL